MGCVVRAYGRRLQVEAGWAAGALKGLILSEFGSNCLLRWGKPVPPLAREVEEVAMAVTR